MSDGAAERQALADKIRGDHKRRGNTVRTMLAVVTSLVVVCGVIGFAWMQLGAGNGDGAAAVAPQHATADYGFELTQAVLSADATAADPAISVDIYEDFLCDTCAIFHDEAGSYLAEQVALGTISLTYYPFSFLRTQSTDEYSLRATNAAACVADQAGVAAYAKMHALLLEHQPAQGGPGLTDDELIAFAAEAAVADVEDGEGDTDRTARTDAITACVTDRTFAPWVDEAMQAAIDADVTETPTVRVNGVNVVKSTDGRTSMPGTAELQYAIEALT